MDSKETTIPLGAHITVGVTASGGDVNKYQGVLKSVDPGSDLITLTADADGDGASSEITVFARDIVNIVVAGERVAPAITSRVSDETMEAIYNANSYTRNPTPESQSSSSGGNAPWGYSSDSHFEVHSSGFLNDIDYDPIRGTVIVQPRNVSQEWQLLDESAPADLAPTDESGIQTTSFTRPVPASVAPPQSVDLELVDDGIKLRSK